jgi:hypothetical protein
VSIYTFIELELPAGAGLADLRGAEQDLESAAGMARYLKRHFETQPLDFTLVDALTTAILVRYSRPFTTGVRKRLGHEVLQLLSKTHREQHEKFRAWRDKHIAHSVNVFEENQLVARYWLEKVQTEGVREISINHTRLVGFSSADVEAILSLIEAILSRLKTVIGDEKAKVLAVVRALPLDDVISRPPKKPPSVPDVSNVAKARKRL